MCVQKAIVLQTDQYTAIVIIRLDILYKEQYRIEVVFLCVLIKG